MRGDGAGLPFDGGVPLRRRRQGADSTIATFARYFANGALIVATGGTGEDDLAALDALRDIVPDREVVGVPCPVIGYGGGGIHCITQQVPRV